MTGEVKAKLYKGSLTVIGRRSAYSLYEYGLATYGDGDTFDRTASKGFIDLHSLPSKTWSTKQGPAAHGGVAGEGVGSSREANDGDSAEGDPADVADMDRAAAEGDACGCQKAAADKEHAAA